MRSLSVLLSFLSFLAASPSIAIGPGEALKDAALEARARGIGRQLRCLVCQNQSIDDSDAPLAQDLRRLVRKRLKAGDTNKQVFAYVHLRYGDFVLLRPPIDTRTWPLWYGPPVFLIFALFLILMRTRRRRQTRANRDSPLSVEETARADALLNGKGDPR